MDTADAQYAPGIYSSSAIGYEGDLYYQTQSSSPQFTYCVLRRRSDDRALAVIRVPELCFSPGPNSTSPFVFDYFGSDAAREWVAHFAPGKGTLVQQNHTYPFAGPMRSWFSWETAVGMLSTGGTVSLLTDPDQPQARTIFQSQSMQGSAKARDGIIAWVDWSTSPTTVRGWTEAGAAPLFQAPEDIAGLALSDSAIAWLGVTGARITEGIYETGRIRWSPFSKIASDIHVHMGPDVSGQVGAIEYTVSTAGDYIAVPRQAKDATGFSGILVAQMSTGRLWSLKPRQGMLMDLAGMSAKEILAFESAESFAKQHATYFERWIRLDLTKLDELAAALPLRTARE